MDRRVWLFSLILALGGGMATGLVVPTLADEVSEKSTTEAPKKPGEIQDDYELLSVLVDTLDQVERNYVKDISRRELLEAAIQGVLEKLDPYSSYITQEDMSRFRTTVESSFGGIGIQITLDGEQLKVLSPLVGTPAYKAGLMAGDRILEINGESTRGITIDKAVEKLKGEAGTKVTIKYQHADGSSPISSQLEREVIQVETVLGDLRKSNDHWDFMLDREHKIGYLRITAFSRDTADDVRQALVNLKSEGMQALILDLRFNPGGLLTAAIEIADLFVTEGKIVSTEGRNSKPRTWEAERDGTFEGFPMVVLVNSYSASASEIVAACLQDHDRAIVIGERTWGKGSVQNVIELEEGRSALKLTTASYQRPNGHKIHRFPDDDEDDEWGVMPNDGFEVKLNSAETRALVEYRHDRDILVAHAKGKPSAEQAKAEEQPAEEAKPAEESQPAAGEQPADEGAKPEDEKKSDEGAAADDAKPEDAPAEEEKPAEKAPDEAPAQEEPQDEGKDAADKEKAAFVDRQLTKALDYLRAELAKQSK
ncbi:MAG: PDZ domain-containing protein [Pirellulales bacterium]|nr:PDZ domain-containing protein [Pirellulales bacterium]